MGLSLVGLPFPDPIHLLPSQVSMPLNPLDQIAFLEPGTFALRVAGAQRTRLLQLQREGGAINRRFLQASGFPVDPPATGGEVQLVHTPVPAGSLKQRQLACHARGGELILGRCVVLTPQIAAATKPPRVPGGRTMGIRAEQILPNVAGGNLLGSLIQGGFGALNTFLSSKFGGTGVPAPTPIPLAAGSGGTFLPAGGNVALATVTPAVVAAGGTIVGTVIRITRAGWSRIPALIKQAAVALGLTVAFTDIGVADLGFGGGEGDGLSMAQQRKISKFTAMTSAGVPPGIAARATGIGRKRAKGISAFELRGFRKISHLLGHVGMVPRGLRAARPVRHHHHK